MICDCGIIIKFKLLLIDNKKKYYIINLISLPGLLKVDC